jgi:hypothetical protein
LKSIKFPGLNDTYTVPEVDATLATTGAAADAKKVGDEINDLKADLTEISEVHGSKTVDVYEYTPVELNLGVGSWTNNGVVFTQNNDGTISAVGTNTHTGGIIFGIRSSSAELTIPLTAGEKYRLTGCPAGGAVSGGYSVTIRLASGGGPLARDIGEGVIIDITETTTYKIHIAVAQGLTINKVFTPKLEKMTVVGQETVDALTAKDDVARTEIGNAVMFTPAQTKTDEEKYQASINGGSVDLNYEIIQAIDNVYLTVLNKIQPLIRLLSNNAYLSGKGAKIYSEVLRMFNLVENKYLPINSVAFAIQHSDEYGFFGGLRIDPTANTKRAVVMSLFNGDHPLKYVNGTNTSYYPVPIPAGATIVYSNNVKELQFDICFHILKYDETLGDYVRVWASSWHNENINGGLFVFDISKFNDGTYYVACGIESSGTETVLQTRNNEDIYIGQKTRSTGGGSVVIDTNLLKGINLTIV